MPRTPEELVEIVMRQYEELGLPGCCGSMDRVHVGWDSCPVYLIPMYKGKICCSH
jgi:hypothetical protein